VPNPADPQNWNRYSYVNNSPINFSDPTGHLVEGDCSIIADESCDPPPPSDTYDPGNDGGGNGGPPSDERKPGDSRCESSFCEEFISYLSYYALAADSLAMTVSTFEAVFAATGYAAAFDACVVTGTIGCIPAFTLALAADMAFAIGLEPYETVLSVAGFAGVVTADYFSGNIGIDNGIGFYVGKDTIVSFRNVLAGLIPEAIIDLS